MSRKEPARRARKVLAALRKEYGDARCLLDHANALELLVATVLAAQCTDERVNQVTKDLFLKYRTAADYAQADQSELERLVRPTGFFRNKAAAIRNACLQIVLEHAGQVPRDMDGLVALPGVGRKTANVVLATCFGRDAIIVDTHLARVTRRIGLTSFRDADKIEADLQGIVPRGGWTTFSHVIGFHGRRICTARKPDCEACCVSGLCDYFAGAQGPNAPAAR